MHTGCSHHHEIDLGWNSQIPKLFVDARPCIYRLCTVHARASTNGVQCKFGNFSQDQSREGISAKLNLVIVTTTRIHREPPLTTYKYEPKAQVICPSSSSILGFTVFGFWLMVSWNHHFRINMTIGQPPFIEFTPPIHSWLELFESWWRYGTEGKMTPGPQKRVWIW